MRVVVVGGGFGGVKTALLLSKQAGLHVTLISNKDHFVYYPSLYAVATGGSQRQSFVRLHDIFAGTSVRLVQDTISGYDPHRRTIRGEKAEYSYDRVVFSLGAVTSYFGIRGLDEYSYGIKSYDEIMRLRHHLHDELTSTRKLDKQYVVVGAGPTGVELAASLAGYIAHIAAAHQVQHSRIRIKLVEAAPRVLPRMLESTSQAVEQHLKRIGVTVLTGEKVEWQDDDEVFVSGHSIPTHTVIWTSGVANNPFFENHSHVFTLDAKKRVIVDKRLMSDPHTYVIGDNAATPYSGLAQTALHDAQFVSRDIIGALHGAMRNEYASMQPPVVVPVGKRWAIFEWYSIRLSGFVGHLIRRAADLRGYSEVLPLHIALKTWRANGPEPDACEICKKYN